MNINIFIAKVSKWIKLNKTDFYTLLTILLIGSFFRLFKISEYMTFLGDEGRDAIIVRRLLVYLDPILIGPGTSIGNMYLGPLYYYLMAPFLFLANFSPVGPSVMVAILSIATIFLIWYISRIWFGRIAANIASLLFALSPVVIIYARSSWNPNIMPFFALLSVVSLWKVYKDGSYGWLSVAGLSMAFVLQSHYLGLLLFPVIFFFWYVKYQNLKKGDRSATDLRGASVTKKFWKGTFAGLTLFLVLMSPLLIFDIRHNGMNYKAVKTFFTQRETTVSIKPWKAIPNIYPIIRDNIAVRIISGKDIFVGSISVKIILATFAIFAAVNLFRVKKILTINNEKRNFNKGMLYLTAWLLTGLVGIGLYKQHVYDHYFGFLYPAVFLYIGAVYQKVYDLHFDGLKILTSAWIIMLVGAYIANSPLRSAPNYQMQRAIEVSKIIRNDVGDAKFNLAVIAVQNYEDGYQYFLEKDGANVVDIDAQRLNETVGQTLYVVCEMAEDLCDPTHSPKAEVANFGWSKIDNKWEVAGVSIFKLVHSEV